MALNFILLAALVAAVQAGGPAAYNIATASADYSSVAYTQESTQKGYGSQNVITSYSKSVNSPHSSVQVNNERITNDASYLTHAIQPAAYAAPVFAKTYAGPTIVTKGVYAPPAITAYHQAAPLLTKHYPAPAFTTYAHSAPAYTTYAQPAPVVHASFTGIGANYAW